MQVFQANMKQTKEVAELTFQIGFDVLMWLIIDFGFIKKQKVFFFNRSATQKQVPVLYQWFKFYYSALTNKVDGCSLRVYRKIGSI
jgi:hypothetical protein